MSKVESGVRSHVKKKFAKLKIKQYPAKIEGDDRNAWTAEVLKISR